MSGSTTFGKHPSSAVLLDYVTGSLGFAHHCVVMTHLPRCPTCRDVVSFWGKVENHLLAGVRPVEPPPDLLERCLASLARSEASPRNDGKAGSEPGTRDETGGMILSPVLEDPTRGRLRWLAPGIRHRTLWRDARCTLHLIRVGAGVMLPAHRHRGLELTCVLSGAYRDDGERYAVGDVSEEDDDDQGDPRRGRDHLVVAEPPEDCVCLMATTGRLRFSGWMARLLQPVMPF